LEAAWSRGGVHKLFEGGQRYFEVEIINLGKPQPKKKLAVSVIGCGREKMKSVPWHVGRYAVGQWRHIPMSGIVNFNFLPLGGKPYTHNYSTAEW